MVDLIVGDVGTIHGSVVISAPGDPLDFLNGRSAHIIFRLHNSTTIFTFLALALLLLYLLFNKGADS
jgi:hypothetical protein